MKKSLVSLLLMATLVSAICLVACSQGGQGSSSASSSASGSSEAASSESSSSAVDGLAYGYAGDDPVEAAAYKYMAEEVSKNFDKADASIPTVMIVAVDDSNPDDVVVYGDFWVENYNIEGDTLECVSGGNFPGVMHMVKDGDSYAVSKFDMVADGADFDSSAKELFGDNYDSFMKIYSDDTARDELRKVTVSNYVIANGLDVAKYQDYGWDPVELYKK